MHFANAGRAMSEPQMNEPRMDNVPCPFCALLCDDLRIDRNANGISVEANGCARSRGMFAASGTHPASPMIGGKPATLEAAFARSAAILRASARPLCIAAGTDVEGMRALVELAERRGGIVDHADSDAVFRNLKVLQDSGWIGTTLTEVRNRADLLVVAGTDVTRHLPRFFERCFGEAEPMFETGTREIWVIGNLPADLAGSRMPVRHVPVARERLAEVFVAMRSLHAGRDLRATSVAGIGASTLSELVGRMQAARYGVLAWAAAELDFAHADLAVHAMCEFVKALNAKTRFSVLPLAGPRADVTAMQVMAWQTGFPMRVSFARGAPTCDPLSHAALQKVEERAIDALVYVDALSEGSEPALPRVPAILLGRASSGCRESDVFIPVSIPGVQHAAHFFRTDSVVALRMPALMESALPSAAQALRQLLQAAGEAR